MGKILLNGVDYSAPSKSGVAGVKGDMESTYRTGYISLTPEEIGALPLNGGTISGNLLSDKNIKITSDKNARHGIEYKNTDTTVHGIHVSGLMIGDLNYNNESYTVVTNNMKAMYDLEVCGNVTAPAFSGNLNGNADTATSASRLGTITVGSNAKPVYLKEGIITACDTTLQTNITGKAASASKADSATMAVHDGESQIITETYAKKSIYDTNSVNMGRKNGSEKGTNSFAFGNETIASAPYSHAEGSHTKASGDASHTEGYETIASASCSHAEGSHTKASGLYSHADGNYTIANNYSSHASGKYNVEMAVGGSAENTEGTAFVVGNGIQTGDATPERSNAFSITYTGIVKAKSTITGSATADYAEFFEWEDGNPNNEDRVGKFVTLNGEKIKIASSNDDYILGIVSGQPFVLGNGDCDTWNGMYLRDEFNRVIYEPAPKTEINEETGEIKTVTDKDGNIIYEGTKPKLNPEYDPDQPYVSRFDRPEWAPVGMLGVLSVKHDGSCQVNGYACCNSEGIATSCNKDTKGALRVIASVSANICKVVLK